MCKNKNFEPSKCSKVKSNFFRNILKTEGMKGMFMGLGKTICKISLKGL